MARVTDMSRLAPSLQSTRRSCEDKRFLGELSALCLNVNTFNFADRTIAGVTPVDLKQSCNLRPRPAF
jgi:hypothetical protein